jgi:predicted Zn finger-like uncharacterized protein
MQLICPNCGATYDVPENVIGPNGRKIRCRACDTSWFEPPRDGSASPVETVAPVAAPPAVAAEPEPPVESAVPPPPPPTPAAKDGQGRRPWLLLLLALVVIGLGAGIASIIWGPERVASRLGISEDQVPLGIRITREPDWRMIAGGSQLVAVTGEIWNATSVEQGVPDVRAELKDDAGKTVYAWTISRPISRLGPGQKVTFDGAAVDVPATSRNVVVSFAGSDAR